MTDEKRRAGGAHGGRANLPSPNLKLCCVVVAVLAFVWYFSSPSSLANADPGLVLVGGAATLPAVLLAFRVRGLRTPGPGSGPGVGGGRGVLGVSFALGVSAVAFAYVLNSGAYGWFDSLPVLGMGLFFYLFVAPVEEALKLAAVYLYPLDTPFFERPGDAAVLGAFVGLGFALAENVVYVAEASVGAGVFQAFAGRTFVAPIHVLLSSISGYYLGVAVHRETNTAVALLKGLSLAAVFHGTYNTFMAYLPAAVALSPLPEGFGFRATHVVFVVSLYLVMWYLLTGVVDTAEGGDAPASTRP